MPPGNASTIKRHTSRSAESKNAIRAAVPDVRCGSALLQKGGGIKSNNSVHPVAPITRSLVLTSLTEDAENATVNTSTTQNAQDYLVKVRVLHGIDLHVHSTKTTCRHPALPEVNVTVNGSTTQSCTAAQHARNHSAWKKHELKFHVNSRNQNPAQSKPDEVISSFITMYVSLTCMPCSCASKIPDKAIAIGEVGELQFPTKQNGDYEISRFFPVIRRQQRSSQSSYALLPAGKIKLCIRVEVEKPVPDRVEISKRPPFALSNFGEALQLKRKQLKATVVPEDNSQKMSNQQLSQFDSDASLQLLKEITIEATRDLVNAENLKIEGRIGEGIHSCVSLGTLQQESAQQVAVKEFRHQHTVPPVNVLRAFQQEYQILKTCRSQNGNEYIVELHGVILEPRLIILMEYFSHNSLAQCLLNEVTWGQMTMKHKATLGLKIARGISWLHMHGMIHRDIKTHNILIGDDLATPNPRVKIGDLGSAVVWSQNDPLLLEEVGSSGYTAPEIFTHQGYDRKVDVWSFGIVLWELTASSIRNRVNPFTGVTGEELVSKVQSGCRPNFFHAHQLCVKPIVEKCWILDPSQRPTMDEVVSDLEKLSTEL
ncbi:TKL protein kinase [Phytophthora nicotianae P1976]|uniref:TKL protein kinase n=1 Tax=Phytophthora nicotianae P1976 TaxID=1317066 RepID=A0A081B1J9_PHYNI|nr:TKL protein kinase [Phytophthora nicotianae P1976]